MVRPVTITAELKQWQLKGKHVTGFIQNSINQDEYKEGEVFTLLNVDIVSYPSFFMARTQTGKYFKLRPEEQIKP